MTTLSARVKQLHAAVNTFDAAKEAATGVDIKALADSAVEEARRNEEKREAYKQKEASGCEQVVEAPWLDPSQRPKGIQDAITFKFEDARRHSGWEMDSAASYDFSGVAGSRIVELLCERRKSSSSPLSVLDAGAGSGDFLYDVEAIVRAHDMETPPFLRGVTAGYELGSTSAERGVCHKYGEGDDGDPCCSLKIYQQFPLEDIATCCEADFVASQCKFDLVVASWTMLHLADPMGTLQQLYSFVAPGGILLVNFCYAHIADGDKAHLRKLMDIVSNDHKAWLGDDDTICIQKTKSDLQLPINYTHGTIPHVWKTVQPQYCVAHYEFAPPEQNNNIPNTQNSSTSLMQFLKEAMPV